MREQDGNESIFRGPHKHDFYKVSVQTNELSVTGINPLLITLWYSPPITRGSTDKGILVFHELFMSHFKAFILAPTPCLQPIKSQIFKVKNFQAIQNDKRR